MLQNSEPLVMSTTASQCLEFNVAVTPERDNTKQICSLLIILLLLIVTDDKGLQQKLTSQKLHGRR